MKQLVNNHKDRILNISAAIVVAGLAYAAFSFGAPNNNGNVQDPYIKDTSQFVLIAENSIHVSNNSQVSSGDIASNKSIHVAENNILNSNLFSDTIQIGDNSSINGTTTSNKLIKAETAEIFGEQNNGITQPIIELPKIEQFQTGSISYIIEENTTIDPGNYDSIEVKENAALTLNPGIYNLNTLTLKDNSKLIYSAETTLNIKKDLKIQNDTLIASNNPNQEETTDFAINYTGKRPVNIGERALVVAKILSPGSRVQTGNNATFLGQVFAKDIHMGEESVLGRELLFSKDTDPEKIVEVEGEVFPINEIILVMDDNATYIDAQNVADSVKGSIIGFIPEIQIFKIEVPTNTVEELDTLIQQLESEQDPKILFIIKNLAGGLN